MNFVILNISTFSGSDILSLYDFESHILLIGFVRVKLFFRSIKSRYTRSFVVSPNFFIFELDILLDDDVLILIV